MVSLLLAWINTPASLLADFLFSVLLTLFLIPMNFVAPVKWIEKAMKKMPVTATFLVAVGWVPYFVVVVFVVSAIYAMIMVAGNFMPAEAVVISLINPLTVITVVRMLVTVLAIIAAAFFVLVYKKSVMGCLDKKFNLTKGDACEAKKVEPVQKESNKEINKDKKQPKVKTEVKKPVAKKQPKKVKTENTAKKAETVKVVEKAAVVKKEANKAVKKTTTAKRKPVKAVEAKK